VSPEFSQKFGRTWCLRRRSASPRSTNTSPSASGPPPPRPHWRGEAGRLGALAAAQRRERAADAAAGPPQPRRTPSLPFSVRPALGALGPPLRGQLPINEPLPLELPGADDAPLGNVEVGVVSG
jgi:hypothetical protein